MRLNQLSRRTVGLVLIGIASLLLVYAWLRSYPLGVESRTTYLYDSIYPAYWLGVFAANAGVFLIATGSTRRWERLVAGFGFFLLAYSLKYFYAIIQGPDSAYFLGLTQDFAQSGILTSDRHAYYQWPLLFLLTVICSRTLSVDVQSTTTVLFLVWNFLLAAGLFLYSGQCDDWRDFLVVVAYGISAYPFLVWQFSAQTFALVIFLLCTILMLREGSSWRTVTIVMYVSLVFAHAFMAAVLALVAILLSIKERKYATIAVVFASIYVGYAVFHAVEFVQSVGSIWMVLFLEYSQVTAATFAAPVTGLDAAAQLASRSLTLSMYALLALATILSLVSKKLRSIDFSMAAGGLLYFVAGSILPILGWRSVQVVIIPAARSLAVFASRAITRKALLVYFFIAMVVFPVGLVHYFYNDTNYMTLREQHAVDTILLPVANYDPQGGFTILGTGIVRGYFQGKSGPNVYWIDEGYSREFFARTTWFNYVLVSPALEKDLLKAGFTDQEISNLEAHTVQFSRIYSNGHAAVLMNPNATGVPGQ